MPIDQISIIDISQFYGHLENWMRHHVNLLLLLLTLLKCREKQESHEETSSNIQPNTSNSKINTLLNSTKIKNKIQILRACMNLLIWAYLHIHKLFTAFSISSRKQLIDYTKRIWFDFILCYRNSLFMRSVYAK